MPPASAFISVSNTKKEEKEMVGDVSFDVITTTTEVTSQVLFSLSSLSNPLSLSLVLHLFVSSNIVLTMVGKTGVQSILKRIDILMPLARRIETAGLLAEGFCLNVLKGQQEPNPYRHLLYSFFNLLQLTGWLHFSTLQGERN